jgi:hypothetical protein
MRSNYFRRARTSANKIYCWGENLKGNLGFATPDRTASPLEMTGLP